MRERKIKALRMAQHIWTSKRPVYQDAVRASHVLSVMIAKLTDDSAPSLQTGTLYQHGNEHFPPATQNLHVSQQDTAVPGDTAYDMMNIMSLESIFENPDTLNWVSQSPEVWCSNTDIRGQNDIDSYLIDYSGGLNHAVFDMPEIIT